MTSRYVNAMQRRCYVHSRSHEMEGHFCHTGIGPKWVWVTLYHCGEEYYAKVPRSKVISQQRQQNLRGRYFAFSPAGSIHVCRCRYTAKMLKEAKARAEELCKNIRVE